MSSSVKSIKITLPDGSVKEFDHPVTAGDVAASIGPGLAKAALAAKVNGEIVDLARPIEDDAEVALLTKRDPEALEVLRHSCTHLMAQAVKRLYGNAMLEDGPPTPEGFWYDIKTDNPITTDDFPRIEEEMQKIVKEALPIERSELSREEALKLFRERGEKYKLAIIENLPDDAVISTYKQGEFIDLCRGPHVPHTGVIDSFKLMSVAGAYWKGDAANDQLTRVRGTAFFDKKALKEHLRILEEAKARDHRKLGRELELFMHHEWAPGETIWLPNGNTIYRTLARMMSELCREEGYVEVFTPMLFKSDLFKTSGHWAHYRENMFIVPGQASRTLEDADIRFRLGEIEQAAPDIVTATEWENLKAEIAKTEDPVERLRILLSNDKLSKKFWNIFERHGEVIELSEEGNEVYALKAMNCPSHMLIFREKRRSYRELPLRIHDQGVLHRNEASGTLSGLTRVRQFCQDDAHIFVPQEQIEEEITKLIALVARVYRAFDWDFEKVYLSTRPDDFLGEKETWDEAEKALENAIKANNLEFTVNEGDGAFYGPKIDFIVKDCLNREWQTATIQLDYQLPARFNLSFTNRDNQDEMPVVVHRAILGSFERFLGMLIEHYYGNFPTWLAPIQARVLTISEKFEDYAGEVTAKLRALGVRVEEDYSAEKIGAKIREGRLKRIPYLLIVGEKEQENRTLSVRSQTEGDLGSFSLDDFLTRIDGEKSKKF